jgi:tetratricopeptide (TPR) repeat protein
MTGTLPEAQGGSMLGAVLKLLRADAPGAIMGAPQAWPRWAALLPHVLAAASHYDSLLRPARGAAGADVSWLLDRAATYLKVHARLAEARPLAERALAITEAAYGPDHPTAATRLNNLALILQDLGQPAEARPLAERALAIGEAAYGPDHPQIVTLRANLSVFVIGQDPKA